MANKTRNDPSKYLSRASLAGAFKSPKAGTPRGPSQADSAKAERRDDKGSIDQRWYLQLPAKR